MLTLDYNEKTYVNWPPADLLAAGVPETLVFEAAIKVRAKAVSAECRRRIYAVASIETQMNMSAATAVISGKAASDRSAEEIVTLTGAASAIGWVTAMRGAMSALSADSALDFMSDDAWPVVPAEVISMLEFF